MKRRPSIVVWLLAAVGCFAPVTTIWAQSQSRGLVPGVNGNQSDAPWQRGQRRPDPTVMGRNQPGRHAPVAMLGYSPVSLLNKRQWVKGREPFKVVFDGATYLFANPREMQMFSAAPERYAPVLGGDCVVHFARSGERRPGLLRHGVVHDDRLFFLSSSENKQAFVDNASRYLDVDVALDGNCPVCLVELNKSVPGQEELAAVLDGRRYLFPGAQQREMFLAQPRKYAAAAHAVAGSGVPAPVTPDAQPRGTLARRTPAGSDASSGPDASGNDASGNDDSGNDDGTAAAPDVQDELPSPIPVSLSGYCPVSILDDSRWIRGKREYGVVLGGRRYLLAGESQRQAFLNDPARYVPALGGDCVVSFKDHGRREEGSIHHAVIHRGRQYFFAGPQEKATFKENPDSYADVDLALAGLCPVTLVETGRQVAGKPRFTAWYNGLRFRLAGRDELEEFEANPRKYAVEASTRMEEAEPPRDVDPTNPFR